MTMSLTVAEIAEKVGGLVEGDGTAVISGLAGVSEAADGDITFLANPRYAAALADTGATAAVVDEGWEGECPASLIRVKNADQAFATVAGLFCPAPARPEPGTHPTAVVDPAAELAPDVSVGPHCAIERGVRVGAGTVIGAGCYVGSESAIGDCCELYPHVSVRERTRMGSRTIVHSGTVIGSDGFGYTREGDSWRKIPQAGVVVIGDDVEIGAGVTIDRARFGRTVIGNGVKIDNLVQVAHNVQIGDNAAIVAQVGIAGSAVLEKNVQVGGQAGIGGHVVVREGAVVAGRAAVTKDVPPGAVVSGYPAMPHTKARKLHANLVRIPELKKRIDAIEQRLEEIEGA